MARKLIDISVPLQNDVPADPPGGHPTIQYIDHQQGLPRMLQFFDGLKAEDLPDGQGWAVEMVQLSTHNGTHLDAPWHFHPTMNRGERSSETKDASLIWEGHKAGRHIGYCHIEKLHNLEHLPSTGFTVSCFPVKIERASAGWTRAVAIIDG
jgi:kynurenine formamidase